jgi:Transcriptional regulator, AbiEi antitoxin
MPHQDRTVDQKIARIASSQHGVVTRANLVNAGITLEEIRHRLGAGSLLREHRGVYRVGHRAPSTEARYLAAVRACGRGAVLSGRAAAHLLGLLRGAPPPPEVTAPTERRVEGVVTHRCRRLDRRDTTLFRAIPITTVPKTLVDLAAVLSADGLARAVHEASIKHRTTPEQVEDALGRRPNSAGAPRLRSVLRGDVRLTLSRLERGFLKALEAAGLPLPETNRLAGGGYVDCRWPAYRLTVELDSYRYHNSRQSWEEDHERRRRAIARGDAFRRYTWRDVFEDPQPMLDELRELISAKRPDFSGQQPY